jgi:hypothetical protein
MIRTAFAAVVMLAAALAHSADAPPAADVPGEIIGCKFGGFIYNPQTGRMQARLWIANHTIRPIAGHAGRVLFDFDPVNPGQLTAYRVAGGRIEPGQVAEVLVTLGRMPSETPAEVAAAHAAAAKPATAEYSGVTVAFPDGSTRQVR